VAARILGGHPFAQSRTKLSHYRKIAALDPMNPKDIQRGVLEKFFEVSF